MPLMSKIKTPEQHHSRCSGAFIGDLTYFTQVFMYISHISNIDASLSILNKNMQAGKVFKHLNKSDDAIFL